MPIKFIKADWNLSVEALKPVVESHFAELPKQLCQLDIAWDVYDEYARLGLICLVLGYLDDKVVAYHISFVMPALHYKSSLHSISDSFWISPTVRGQGVAKQMFTFVEQQMYQLGVKVILQNTRSEYPFPFDKLGYTAGGQTFIKDLTCHQ